MGLGGNIFGSAFGQSPGSIGWGSEAAQATDFQRRMQSSELEARASSQINMNMMLETQRMFERSLFTDAFGAMTEPPDPHMAFWAELERRGHIKVKQICESKEFADWLEGQRSDVKKAAASWDPDKAERVLARYEGHRQRQKDDAMMSVCTVTQTKRDIDKKRDGQTYVSESKIEADRKFEKHVKPDTRPDIDKMPIRDWLQKQTDIWLEGVKLN